MSAGDSYLARNEPLVTIAVPTFNRASLLRRCVTSALAQTYPRFEVLVSDNASSDDTAEVLRAFDNEQLRVIRQQSNIGLQPNFNACLAAARGEYIVFMSDDDTIESWFLERCVSLVAGRPEIPVVIGLSDFDSAPLNHTFAARTSRHLATGIRSGTDILLAFLKNEIWVVATCSVMFRTDILRRQGGFPPDFPHTSDVAAWAPLLFRGEAGFLNEACATWRSHGDSETSRLGVERILRDGSQMAAHISALADQKGLDQSTRRLIKLHSRRYFAGRGLGFLSEFRRNGAGLRPILNVIWRFRRNLSDVDLRAILKLVANILCPRPIADRVRRLKKL